MLRHIITIQDQAYFIDDAKQYCIVDPPPNEYGCLIETEEYKAIEAGTDEEEWIKGWHTRLNRLSQYRLKICEIHGNGKPIYVLAYEREPEEAIYIRMIGINIADIEKNDQAIVDQVEHILTYYSSWVGRSISDAITLEYENGVVIDTYHYDQEEE